MRYVLPVSLLLGTAGCCWHAVKPLPAGLDHQGALLPAEDVLFLRDQTWRDDSGVRQYEQQIFDEAFAMITRAQRLVVADMFLYNTFAGRDDAAHRDLCEELTTLLLERKHLVPQLRIILTTDPINTVYGGIVAAHLKRLEEGGVEVVITRLDKLRDSNPLWSEPWRILFKPWGNSHRGGWMPNPFGGKPVTMRSWLTAFNFKANHRKVLITDDNNAWRALVTSANPHDGSSAHSNVALAFSGPAVHELAECEQAVVSFSAPHLPLIALAELESHDAIGLGATDELPDDTLVQVVTEEAVARTAEYLIKAANPGERLDIVMFYLADRPIVRAIKEAARRGVVVRLVLDPNKDAFGYSKSGMPNRQVAHELHSVGVAVRWAATHGEQMHTKLLLVRRMDQRASLLLGSANYTRRNLRNYNLETNVRLEGYGRTGALSDAAVYVDGFWDESGGKVLAVPYETHQDGALWRRWLYRFQEGTGLSTW